MARSNNKQHYANPVRPPSSHLLLLFNHSNTKMTVRVPARSNITDKFINSEKTICSDSSPPLGVCGNPQLIILSYQHIISNQIYQQHQLHTEPVSQWISVKGSSYLPRAPHWVLFENSLDELFGIDGGIHRRAPSFLYFLSSWHQLQYLFLNMDRWVSELKMM